MEKYGVIDSYICKECGEILELPHDVQVPKHLTVEGEKTGGHIHDFTRMPEEIDETSESI